MNDPSPPPPPPKVEGSVVTVRAATVYQIHTG